MALFKAAVGVRVSPSLYDVGEPATVIDSTAGLAQHPIPLGTPPCADEVGHVVHLRIEVNEGQRQDEVVFEKAEVRRYCRDHVVERVEFHPGLAALERTPLGDRRRSFTSLILVVNVSRLLGPLSEVAVGAVKGLVLVEDGGVTCSDPNPWVGMAWRGCREWGDAL